MDHTILARQIAEESAVLLKIEGLLPFSPVTRWLFLAAPSWSRYFPETVPERHMAMGTAIFSQPWSKKGSCP